MLWWLQLWHAKYAFRFSTITLTSIFIFSMGLTHWIACLWNLAAVVAPDQDENWVAGMDGGNWTNPER